MCCFFKTLKVQLNDTSELEQRVTELEEDFAILTDEFEELETDNALQNERLVFIEVDITVNEDDINSKSAIILKQKFTK